MIDWGLYEKTLSYLDGNFRDRIIEREKSALLKQFVMSPATKNAIVDGQQKMMIVKSTQALNEKTFVLSPGDDIKIGDIVVWENLHWLVVELDFDNTIALKGRITQCNRQIRWQNVDTGEIIERWCLLTKPYTSNVTNGTQLSVSNREYKVQIPYDNETKLVDLDKRFMLEVIDGRPRTYSCTSVDQQTNVYQDLENGFIVWNLSQDAAGQPDDNVELMICNYVSPTVYPTPSSIAISGPDLLRATVGQWPYTIDLAEGVTDVVWDIAAQETVQQYLHVVQESASKILISADHEAIGASFEIVVSNIDGEEMGRKLVEVVDIYG